MRFDGFTKQHRTSEESFQQYIGLKRHSNIVDAVVFATKRVFFPSNSLIKAKRRLLHFCFLHFVLNLMELHTEMELKTHFIKSFHSFFLSVRWFLFYSAFIPSFTLISPSPLISLFPLLASLDSCENT